jgi:hypothetical protein
MTSIYEEILDLFSKFETDDYEVERMIKHANEKLKRERLSDQWGIDFTDWNGNVDSYLTKGSMGAHAHEHFIKFNENCSISWSDDGRQPEKGERLYQLSFSTGAYIFGDHYPKELFNQFFVELKAYKPKYSDTNNKCLYFDKQQAKWVHDAYFSILKRYQSKSKQFRKIQQLQAAEDRVEALRKELGGSK